MAEEQKAKTQASPTREERAAREAARRRLRRACIAAYIVVFTLLIALAAAAPLLLYKEIRFQYTAELGTGLPDPTVFFRDGVTGEIAYVNPPQISRSEPGRYKLTVTGSYGRRTVFLETEDTLPPTAEDAGIAILVTETALPPEKALQNIYDASGWTAAWNERPVFGTDGTYDCSVLLTDSLGHTSNIPCRVTIRSATRDIILDVGMELPDPSLFFPTPPEGLIRYTDTTAADLTAIGDYTLYIENNGIEYPVCLSVRDLTAPTAQPSACHTWNNYSLSPEDFVTDIQDCTAVTVSFAEEPDWLAIGQQTVTVILTDEGGNTTQLSADLEISEDTAAPEIHTLPDAYVYVGDTIRYLEAVKVYDDVDESPTLAVDKSAVNPREAGSYDVIYTATDRAGNTSETTVTFHFLEPSASEEELRAQAGEILDEILTDDMTDADRAWTIFSYVYENVAFSSQVLTHTDWLLAADTALKDRKGDCYVSAALFQLLMTEAGYEALIIEHSYARGYTHLWNMVNIGTGWYHCDTTRLNQNRVDPKWCYMRTVAELEAHPYGANYWGFDPALYPLTATELFTS